MSLRPETASGSGTLSLESDMSTIGLKLNISTLKAIVVLCRITGESLRRSFADERIESHERCAIFAQWIRVRWNMEVAERLLLDQECSGVQNGKGQNPNLTPPLCLYPIYPIFLIQMF